MHLARFARSHDLARPDVQTRWLFPVESEFFKALLHPLPVLQGRVLRKRPNGWMLLCVALENTRADQVNRVGHGMYQGLGVIDDDSPGSDPLLEPINKPLAQFGFLTGSFG